MYPTCRTFKRMHANDAAAGAKLWQIAHLPRQLGLLLEILYTSLLSVITTHYHRLYQTLSLEVEV